MGWLTAGRIGTVEEDTGSRSAGRHEGRWEGNWGNDGKVQGKKKLTAFLAMPWKERVRLPTCHEHHTENVDSDLRRKANGRSGATRSMQTFLPLG